MSNYWLNNYKEIVWLIGDGRSGSTWVADLISRSRVYRQMFEPFHPGHVKETEGFSPHQYLRPTEEHESIDNFFYNVIAGKFLHPRVDSGNRRLLYKGILVKDIYAKIHFY